METKICTKCGNEYPATLSFFRKQKRGKYGLNCTCKMCLKVYRKTYASTDKAKKAHAERERKRRIENPERQKQIRDKSYKLHSHEWNEKRKLKYKTDEEFRLKKYEQEKKYKESGRRHEVSTTPEQAEKSRIRRKKRYYANPEKEKEAMAKWKEKKSKLYERKK